MSEQVNDRDEITRVVQLCIDGERSGDASKLREAFHEDARMYGNLGDQRLDVPIEELFAMSDGNPADVDGSYRARIVSVEHVGDAAIVKVEEEGYWGSVSFTDFFSLASIKGEWKIVNKTFAHTGGEPPTG
jgi:putative lumazine-binding protein